MPRYAETQKLLERDATKVSPDAAVKNIEMWEESLSEMESKEGKAVVRDLGALKKELQKGKPNGEKIVELMQKLGEQTVAMAEQAGESNGEKLRGIGEALSNAEAGEGEESEDEDEDGEEEVAAETEEGNEGAEKAPVRRTKSKSKG